MKTKVFFAFCLVLSLVPGCGDTDPDQEIVVDVAISATGFVQAAPLYNVSVPDSFRTALIWNHNSPLSVRTITRDEYTITGDTVLSGTDPFFSFETDRLEMALSIARAVEDTAAADSLSALLADSSSFVYVTSSRSGSIQGLVSTGSILQPGDTIAIVTGPPPDSLFILSPAYSHIRWPEPLPGCTVTPHGLQCTGPWPGAATSIPGTWSVQPQFIHEEGLLSFLLAAAGDTISITVIGYTDTSRIIYCTFLLDSIALIPW
ncbi:MAG: hypothetical protein KAH31_03480 [Candidatus Sabulitectum sp.]|nr:hypothetical protein [Candidatus Sabulitectum sp.]